MSVAPSGNKGSLTYRLKIPDASYVGEARRLAQNWCASLEFDEVRTGRVGIVVNELSNNLAKYGKNGHLFLRRIGPSVSPAIEIISVDEGPGFDVEVSLHDGFTTGTTPGTGLGAVQRLTDIIDIYSSNRGSVILSCITKKSRSEPPTYELGSVNFPYPEEAVSGDGWAAVEDQELRLFMADGLGHGVHAHQAASEALDCFLQYANENPDRIINNVHQKLKSTRGGAVFVLQTSSDKIDFSGVGNIRAVLQTPSLMKTLISQNGTAGLQIRAARASAQAWDGQGYLILHTDGLGTKWDFKNYPGLYGKHPGIVAALLARDFNRGNDDCTVVVARRTLL